MSVCWCCTGRRQAKTKPVHAIERPGESTGLHDTSASFSRGWAPRGPASPWPPGRFALVCRLHMKGLLFCLITLTSLQLPAAALDARAAALIARGDGEVRAHPAKAALDVFLQAEPLAPDDVPLLL